MMFYGIIIAFTLIVLGICAYFVNKVTKINKELTNELISEKKKPFIIGRITKYKESEIDLLLSNPEVIDLLLKVFEYKIAMKTDSIRSLEKTDEKVGYLNCLHENHLFFYKLKQKLEKKEQKIGQSLV